MAEKVAPVGLKPETLQAFESYIRTEEAAMPGNELQWPDRKGRIAAAYSKGKGPERIPAGLIHDWIGVAMIPGATIQNTLARMQDYDNHKNIYQPDVIDSRLIARHQDDFQIQLRLLKKKIITVVLDTDHAVHYFHLDSRHCGCRSYTTRVAEVDDAGKPNEIVHPPDTGYGFLWRLNSYWRLSQQDGAVIIECRAISLTRDVPAVLRLIVDPMVRSLPKEALIHTLKATRDAVLRPRQKPG
ncbi:MAG: hypothetical protein ABSH50_28585 [Bryobacteraceae bacterium]|jgi:hypothetical protein